jgi:hypothetical protein
MSDKPLTQEEWEKPQAMGDERRNGSSGLQIGRRFATMKSHAIGNLTWWRHGGDSHYK